MAEEAGTFRMNQVLSQYHGAVKFQIMFPNNSRNKSFSSMQCEWKMT